MRSHIEDWRDPQTGEVNQTRMAEDTCLQFGPFAGGYGYPEDCYYEWAYQIVQADVHRRAHTMPDWASRLVNERESTDL